MHTMRDSWLRAATNELRPYFKQLGYDIPEKIRESFGFPSSGRRSKTLGECWHPSASEDQHHEIFIRPDQADPVAVLSLLVHELVHSVLPSTVKHGKEFRIVATRVGLEGPMRQTQPGPMLRERLNALAKTLGPLPHGKLNFNGGSSDVPKRQKSRMLKAECGKACGYTIRLAAKWAREGLPVCPIDTKHGRLICDIPEPDEEEEIPAEAVSEPSKRH